MSIVLENNDPTVLYNGLNTNKNAVFNGQIVSNGSFIGNGLIVDAHPTTSAINATATATAAQLSTGYITSTSAAVTTITLPTGTLLGAQVGASQGTQFTFYVDNTLGASTVTIAVAVNGILNAAAAAGAGTGFGLLSVPAGVTGLGQFTIIFNSATAYSFARTA
jgi:hypothetical protein